MIYTGIGPRNAPQRVLEVCREIGTYMAQQGWTLRTGAGEDGVSSGCDFAFRTGCELALPDPMTHFSRVLLEVYCPMDGVSTHCQPQWFRSSNTKRFYAGSDQLAKALVRALHVKGKGLAPGHLELHSRNVHQQMGANVGGIQDYTRSDLVILWSPEGAPTTGGTGMSQKIYDLLPGRCSQFNIGMFDLDNPVDVESLWAHLRLIVQSLEMEKQ